MNDARTQAALREMVADTAQALEEQVAKNRKAKAVSGGGYSECRVQGLMQVAVYRPAGDHVARVAVVTGEFGRR